MTIIAPSLLSADFLNLSDEIKKFDGLDQIWFHLDIMDGHFVPNLTFGHAVIKNLSNITEHKLDAHLMVTNPQDYILPFESAKVHNFTFHWESVTHHDRLIQVLKKHFKSVGISLNPSTPIEVIPDYIYRQIDLILIMTVNPGFGGQSFIEGCMEKIEALDVYRKQHKLSFQIQVDGGVKNTNSNKLIKAGANNLVAGSYVFGEPNKDYAARIKALRS